MGIRRYLYVETCFKLTETMIKITLVFDENNGSTYLPSYGGFSARHIQFSLNLTHSIFSIISMAFNDKTDVGRFYAGWWGVGANPPM